MLRTFRKCDQITASGNLTIIAQKITPQPYRLRSRGSVYLETIYCGVYLIYQCKQLVVVRCDGFKPAQLVKYLQQQVFQSFVGAGIAVNGDVSLQESGDDIILLAVARHFHKHIEHCSFLRRHTECDCLIPPAVSVVRSLLRHLYFFFLCQAC